MSYFYRIGRQGLLGVFYQVTVTKYATGMKTIITTLNMIRYIVSDHINRKSARAAQY